MIVKKHNAGGRLVLAVCDTNLLGKRFSDPDKALDLTASFYQGTEMTHEDAILLMKKAYIINLVGEESVAVAKSLGLVHEDIIRIEGIPHAQVLVVPEE